MIPSSAPSGSPWLETALERVRGELADRLTGLAELNLMVPDEATVRGKLLRPRLLLTLASPAAETLPLRRVAELAAAVELIHLATLHHDDVLDDSPHRRRGNSARAVFGNKVSILFGDALLAAALDALLRSASRRMQFAVARAVTATLRGEMAQHLGHRSFDVSERECVRVAAQKTGSLFGLAARIGAMLGGANPEQVATAYRLGRRLGTAFQLIDDALDYAGEESLLGKQPGADYRQGIATLPLVRAWRFAAGPDRSILEAGFGANGQSDFHAVREIVLWPASFEPALAAGRRHLESARALLTGLAPDLSAPLLTEYFSSIEARIPVPSDARTISQPG